MSRSESRSYYWENGEAFYDQEREQHINLLEVESKRIHDIADQRNRAYDAARDFKRERDAAQVERDHYRQIIIELYLSIDGNFQVESSNAYFKAEQVYERHQSTEAWDDMNEAEKRTWDDSVQGERI